MELQKLVFPRKGDYYLKNIFLKNDEGVSIKCGAVTLEKGKVLPFKTLDQHEVSYLVSGKLKVITDDGYEEIMNAGDLIYLNSKEVRKTETLEDSHVLFFLYEKEH